ncbi:uncharacterized protein [Euwallacea fornicatus]|uniref:uncharacterized protein n=1 Tax=Euwallacea fornicatus TaxID=995702 RepID=UPI0033900014
MSAATYETVGTGDESLNIRTKDEEAAKTLTRGIILEILDNAIDIVDNDVESSADQIKHDPVKNKPSPSIRGSEVQRSNEVLEGQEPVCNFTRVDKKNRLTVLVKNSKQVVAKMISSKSKSGIREEMKEEEKLIEVINIDCADDKAFTCPRKWPSEEVLLSEQDTGDIMEHLSEEHMYEVNLDPSIEDSVEDKKVTTFKRKRWDVGRRIAGFCRKIKKGNHDDSGSRSQQDAAQSELKETHINVGGRSTQMCCVL